MARAARYLMAVSSHPVISDTTHVSYLPPSWGSLAILAQLSESQFLELLESGAIHPELECKGQ